MPVSWYSTEAHMKSCRNKKGSAAPYLIILRIIALARGFLFMRMNWRRFKAEAGFTFTIIAIIVILILILVLVVRHKIRKAKKEKEKAAKEAEKLAAEQGKEEPEK